MEKCSLTCTREFIGILKSQLYFEVNITLYTSKKDTLSFVTEALVPIKLQFVMYNTYIYTSKMKNGHFVAPKNPCDLKVY